MEVRVNLMPLFPGLMLGVHFKGCRVGWSGQFGEEKSEKAQRTSVISGPEFVLFGLDYLVCNSKGLEWKVNRA
jgi:hypothetical protein